MEKRLSHLVTRMQNTIGVDVRTSGCFMGSDVTLCETVHMVVVRGRRSEEDTQFHRQAIASQQFHKLVESQLDMCSGCHEYVLSHAGQIQRGSDETEWLDDGYSDTVTQDCDTGREMSQGMVMHRDLTNEQCTDVAANNRTTHVNFHNNVPSFKRRQTNGETIDI